MAAIVSGPGAETSWSVYAGDRNRELCEFLAGTDPWDITGCVITAQARLLKDAPEVAVEAVVVLTEPGVGLATVAWDGEAIRALLVAEGITGKDTWRGYWDLQMLEPGETLPLTLAAGPFIAGWDVTREATP